MNVFEKVKASVTVKQAAENLGLKADKNGMALCPFHNDRHPSLKLNDGYFYCFGCGASGDVIELTSRLLGLSRSEAAGRLAADFGISADKTYVTLNKTGLKGATLRNLDYLKPGESEAKKQYFLEVLTDYLAALNKWKAELAPKTPYDEFNENYTEGCQMLPYIGYLVDVLELGHEAEKEKAVELLSADDIIPRLEKRLRRIRKEETYEESRRKADRKIGRNIER